MAVFPAFFGLLMAALVTGQYVDITPQEAVRRIGDDLTVLCKVPYPIDSCRMTVGVTPYRLIPGSQEGDVVYAGQGLAAGECGAHIKGIKEEWNGNISCVLPPKTGSIEITGIMRLRVAKAPGNPQLISPPQSSFKEGEELRAQCVVPDGRPAAKIRWYLDDEELIAGVHQPYVTSEPGSDLETISQNISRTLSADDVGRVLICRTEHEALDRPMEAKKQLVVVYPPKSQESDTIKIFGLKLNAEGRLNVTVRANPPPEAVWTVGDLKLVAPEHSEDNAIFAMQPLHLGSGFYNVTLLLSRITTKDVERAYYLTVTNSLGKEDFIVRISTMAEPIGVKLDAGAIVGIVVAVLVLLVAVFLTVFAFATHRWCFAGRGVRDHTKSSGESSDTESAVGGKERSRLASLGARMRAALPRGKDKVQATEAPASEVEEKLPEDKVVYAQLALSEQTTADKPPPPSTEYAEIVYTDQQAPKDVKE